MKKNSWLWSIGIMAGLIIAIGIYTSQQFTPIASTVTLQNHPYEVTILTKSRPTDRGESVTIRLEVREDGELVDLLERKSLIHAALIGQSLTDVRLYNAFETLPRLRPGVYEFTQELVEANYDLWVEINGNITQDHHGDKAEYRARAFLPVNGASSPPIVKPQDKVEIAGGEYSLELLGDNTITTNSPHQFRIKIEHNGEPVALLPNTDHFYFISSSDENIYELSHVDHEAGSEAEGILSTFPVTFPQIGMYTLWVQTYTANDAGGLHKIVNAPFIFEVK